MPTCSQITDALNTLASATTNPNILADLSGQTAVLSNIGTTETVVSLFAGGPAVLSAPSSPSLDGLPFRISIAGKVHFSPGGTTTFNPQVYLGNSSTVGNNLLLVSIPGGGQTSVTGGTDSIFFLELEGIWSAASGYFGGLYSHFNSGSGVDSITTKSAASQTDLQFVVTGQFNAGNAANSVTITQFKMQFA